MKRIVVGYDGSGDGERVLRRAAGYAEAFSARLIVVAVGATVPVPVVVPPGTETAAAAMPAVRVPPVPVERDAAIEAPLEAAERGLSEAERILAGISIECEFRPEIGDPAERLLGIAEETGADLLVVGSREHGFLERLLGGKPVDEKLVRYAPRDVLVVRG